MLIGNITESHPKYGKFVFFIKKDDSHKSKKHEFHFAEEKIKPEEILIDNPSEYSDNIFMKLFEMISNLFKKIFYYILPSIETYPIFALLVILLIVFYHSKLIVYLVEDISYNTKISASFIGVTLITWAGNVGDSMNAAMAAKAKAVDLLTTSILASQILNLHICLGVPWIIAMIKNSAKNKGQYFIDFGTENVYKLFLPLLCVVVTAVFIVFIFNRVLDRFTGTLLTIVYFIYFVYESYYSIRK